MEQIQIKPYVYSESEVTALYHAVGWMYYVNHPEVLKKAYANSLCTLGAYDADKLVGLIRCVGDGYTILFVQDLLVLPAYQRRGIGTRLMRAVLEKYSYVYQLELATDNTEKNHFLLSIPGLCSFTGTGLLRVYEKWKSHVEKGDYFFAVRKNW